MLQFESVALFVHDIEAAAAWCPALLSVPVERENLRYAFVRALHGVIIGFQPAGAKNPGGVPGTMPCWKWPTSMPHWPRSTAAPASPTSAPAWH